MSDDDKIYGPYSIDLRVHVTDGDQFGILTWNGAAGRPMEKGAIDSALLECEKQTKEQLGDDWRLCTKQEFFNELMFEKTGQRVSFSPPGGYNWDAD